MQLLQPRVPNFHPFAFCYGGYLTTWFVCLKVPEQMTEWQREVEVFIIKPTLEW